MFLRYRTHLLLLSLSSIAGVGCDQVTDFFSPDEAAEADGPPEGNDAGLPLPNCADGRNAAGEACLIFSHQRAFEPAEFEFEFEFEFGEAMSFFVDWSETAERSMLSHRADLMWLETDPLFDPNVVARPGNGPRFGIGQLHAYRGQQWLGGSVDHLVVFVADDIEAGTQAADLLGGPLVAGLHLLTADKVSDEAWGAVRECEEAHGFEDAPDREICPLPGRDGADILRPAEADAVVRFDIRRADEVESLDFITW